MHWRTKTSRHPVVESVLHNEETDIDFISTETIDVNLFLKDSIILCFAIYTMFHLDAPIVLKDVPGILVAMKG